MNDQWVEACKAEDVPRDGLVRFDHGDQTYAIYRTQDDGHYATAGLCTHARVHLAGGFAIDNQIECPKHNDRFDFTTGKAMGVPACVTLQTYQIKIKVESGPVLINIGA